MEEYTKEFNNRAWFLREDSANRRIKRSRISLPTSTPQAYTRPGADGRYWYDLKKEMVELDASGKKYLKFFGRAVGYKRTMLDPLKDCTGNIGERCANYFHEIGQLVTS